MNMAGQKYRKLILTSISAQHNRLYKSASSGAHTTLQLPVSFSGEEITVLTNSFIHYRPPSSLKVEYSL